MKKFTAVLLSLMTFTLACNSADITKFDIDGIKLRQTYEEIKDKYPCTQYYGPSIKFLYKCSVNDNKRVHEKIIEKEFKVDLGVTGQVMSIQKTFIINSEDISELKLNETFKKFGNPVISSDFIIGKVKYKSYCWGDCTASGNSFKRGEKSGQSFVYTIRFDGVSFENTSELEDRELYQKYWDHQKANN